MAVPDRIFRAKTPENQGCSTILGGMPGEQGLEIGLPGRKRCHWEAKKCICSGSNFDMMNVDSSAGNIIDLDRIILHKQALGLRHP